MFLNLSNVWIITLPKAAAQWLAKFSYPIAMAMTTDGNLSPRLAPRPPIPPSRLRPGLSLSLSLGRSHFWS